MESTLRKGPARRAKTNASIEIQDSSDEESDSSGDESFELPSELEAEHDMSLDSLGSASDGGASLVEDFGTAIEREIKECTICRDDVPLVAYPDDSTTKSCTHEINICGEFLRRHIEAEVNGKGETVGVKCPVSRCREPLSFSDVHRLAETAIFERYDTLLLRKSLQALDGFRWCKNASCGSGQVHEGGVDAPIMSCSACKAKSCFQHDCPWHTGFTCEQYDIKLAANNNNAAMLAYVAANTKPCPTCKEPIEKNSGCDHMTCRPPMGCDPSFASPTSES